MCDAMSMAVMSAAQMGMQVAAERQRIKAENRARELNYQRATAIAKQDLTLKYQQETKQMQDEAVAKSAEFFKVDQDLNAAIAEMYVEGDAGEGVDAAYLADRHMASFRGYTDSVYSQDKFDTSARWGRNSVARTQAGFRAASAWKGKQEQSPGWFNVLKIGMAGAQGDMKGKAMFGDTDVTPPSTQMNLTGPGSGNFKPTVGVPNFRNAQGGAGFMPLTQMFIPTW